MKEQKSLSSEEHIRLLQERLKLFTDFALAHEEFEAAMLNDDSAWFDKMPDDVHDLMEKTQRLRNQALLSQRRSGEEISP